MRVPMGPRPRRDVCCSSRSSSRLGALPFEGHYGDVSGHGPLGRADGRGRAVALLRRRWLDLPRPALPAVGARNRPRRRGPGPTRSRACRSRSTSPSASSSTSSSGVARTELAGLAAASLYLFNPAVILAGPVWGQVDRAGTLAFLGALLAARYAATASPGARPCWRSSSSRSSASWRCRCSRWRRSATVARPGTRRRCRALGGMALTWLVVGGPLALHPLRYAGLVSDTRAAAAVHLAACLQPVGPAHRVQRSGRRHTCAIGDGARCSSASSG